MRPHVRARMARFSRSRLASWDRRTLELNSSLRVAFYQARPPPRAAAPVEEISFTVQIEDERQLVLDLEACVFLFVTRVAAAPAGVVVELRDGRDDQGDEIPALKREDLARHVAAWLDFQDAAPKLRRAFVVLASASTSPRRMRAVAAVLREISTARLAQQLAQDASGGALGAPQHVDPSLPPRPLRPAALDGAARGPSPPR